MTFHRVRTIAATALIAAAPLLAAAQTAPAAPATTAPPAAPRAIAGQDGFGIESANGDFRLQVGLLVHADGRFAVDDDNDQVLDTFLIRRVRPYFRGRFARRFEFYLNPDFAGGTLVVQDAYIDTVFSPALRIRAGKAKAPLGFERLHSASNLLFLERALPTALAPNRDVGIQVLGDLAGGRVSYLAGVGNGAADGGSADGDVNDGKDVTGRLVARPVRGLGIGISGSRGEAVGPAALPTLRTQTLQQPYFSYATGTTAAGTRTRYSPYVWYIRGPFAGWAEYVKTTTPISRGGVGRDVDHSAWQLAASWVLTGEAATDAGIGVRPRAPFDFGNGNWGALQLAVRWHGLTVDRDAVALAFAAPGASRQAESWTAGLNWYLAANLRYTFNFERTVFDGAVDGPRAAEHALAFRTQINF